MSACEVNTWAMIRGKLTRISDAEADDRYFSPADGVYDDAFHKERREHTLRVTTKYDGKRPDD